MIELRFRFAGALRELVQPGLRPPTARRPYLLPCRVHSKLKQP